MKKSILSSFLLICCMSLFAQSPEFINYQGVLRDANGNVLSNTTIKPSSTIEIDAGGTTYTNPFPASVVTNAYGLFSARISLNPNNANIDWNNTGVKIRSTIEYDANGTAQSIQGSWEELSSVPYALYANEVKNYPETGNDGEYLKWDASANNGNGSWISSAVSSGNTLPNSATIGQVLTWSGVEWVAQDNDGYEANSDDQKIQGTQLNGTVLTIGIERGNSEDVDLATLQDGYEPNTDNQDLELSNNNLSLTNDNTPVDLSSYLDNTDNQNAAQVDYSNTNSGLSASTVQAALDEVDGKIPTNTLTTDYLTKWNGSSFENSNIINKINSNNSNFQYIGIGVNDPKSNLHIGSISPVDNLLHLSVDASNTTAKRSSGISFSHDNDAAGNLLAAFVKAEQYAVNDNRTNLVFGNRTTNSSTATADVELTLRYDGNLGIGVTDPQFKLDLGTNAYSIIRTRLIYASSYRAENSGGLGLTNNSGTKGVFIDDDGLVQVGESNNFSSTSTGTTMQVNGDIEVSGSIKADDVYGVGFEDDGGNLGLWVRDGGNVGVNTLNPDYKLDVNGDARISGNLGVNTTPNNSYKLDVNGDARIGWHGDNDKIVITPFDVRPYNGFNYSYNSGEDVGLLQDNGASVRYETYDMLIPVYIPVGYRMTGCVLNYNNPPDDVYIYWNHANGGQSVQRKHDSTPTSGETITLSSSDYIDGGYLNYATIKLANDNGNICEFNGGHIIIERIP